MIPRAYVQAWSAKAPWPDLREAFVAERFGAKPFRARQLVFYLMVAKPAI